MTTIPTNPSLLKRALLRTALLLIFAVGLAGCLDDVPSDLDTSSARLTQEGTYKVSYLPSSAIPMNTLHTWTLEVTTPDGRGVANAHLTVDGDMPQHGHGLPTQPRVTEELGGGRYLVEGMKFQMGGWWVVDVHITADGVTDTVRFNLLLE